MLISVIPVLDVLSNDIISSEKCCKNFIKEGGGVVRGVGQKGGGGCERGGT